MSIGLKSLVLVVLAASAGDAAGLRSRSELGGSCTTVIAGLAVDSKGFVYQTGTTTWPDFPTTPGPLSQFHGNTTPCISSRNVFVRKLKPDGTVVYSVLVGGSYGAQANAIAVDGQGNVYVTGSTDSADFPVLPATPQAHLPERDDMDVFVFKLNSTGTALLFSRLFGGNGWDEATGLFLAPDGRTLLVGRTESNGIPVTSGALQTAPASKISAFVLRLAADGSLDYGTYLGGTGGASASDVASDSAGDIYVAGFAGAFFPTIAGSFAPQEPAGGFVSKIDHRTGQLIYSTYIPGVAYDSSWPNASPGPTGPVQLRVDSNSNVYVSGTAGIGFLTTVGAFQRAPGGDPRMLRTDGFLLELDAAGRNLIFATLIGGAGDEDVYGLALTGDTVTIAGRTRSPDFPASDHSLPSCNLASFTYPSAIFLASFNRSGKLITSVQYGTCSREVVTSLVAASSGVLLAAWYADQSRTFLASIDLASTTPVGISAVGNAASFEMGTCTPLEIVTVIGSGLGPKQGVGAPAANLPFSLGGTQLFFNGQPAPLLFVQEHQINAIVPGSVARVGVASIWAASTAGGASSAVLLTATEIFSPGLFTVDGSGIGQGAILNQDGSINSASNAASRGSIVSLFWTGGGVTNPPYADGQVISTTAPLLYGAAAIIGDQFAYRDDVLYAGAAPGLVNGMLQLNIRIPQNAPTGPAVPIAVFSSLGSDTNIPSQPGVTISVK